MGVCVSLTLFLAALGVLSFLLGSCVQSQYKGFCLVLLYFALLLHLAGQLFYGRKQKGHRFKERKSGGDFTERRENCG